MCIFIDDRGLQSTDDTASCARVYQTVVTADKRRRSQRVEHDVRAKQTKACDAERTWFLTPMRALVPNQTRPVRHHIYLQHLALRLRLSASTRLGDEPATASYHARVQLPSDRRTTNCSGSDCLQHSFPDGKPGRGFLRPSIMMERLYLQSQMSARRQ